MKTKYPYSKELKAPTSFGEVDYERITLDGSMERVSAFLSKVAASFKCRLANMEKIEIASSDGTSFPCYVFTPKSAPQEKGYPAMIYYHGGGFMFPVQKPMMKNSELFASKTGVKVFLPDYRISLNCNCETIMADCMAALHYVFEHAENLQVDASRVLLYGDSAGGALASSVAIWNRDANAYPLCGQLLAYPVCDKESWKYPSVEAYKDAVWTKNGNEAMWRVYLGRGCHNLSRFIPMANDLQGLPPTYIEAAEMDTLCDEALAFSEKLRKSGVDVEEHTIVGAFHGYDADLKSPLTKRSFERRYAAIRRFVYA